MNKIWKLGLVAIVLIVAVIVYINYPRLNIITGFATKNDCSCLFEAGRDLASYKVDTLEKTVSSRVFGLKTRTAVFHQGMDTWTLTNRQLKTATFPLSSFHSPLFQSTTKNGQCYLGLDTFFILNI